ncbi:MAG: bifunctional riboflavin kinase/FAD synthetase [Anaerolineales bacterium]
MRHIISLDQIQLERSYLTIGSFDGVHLGHQKIINELVTSAHSADAPAVVLTFHPHPAIVLKKRNDPFYLTTREEKADLLGDLGVDVVVTQPFDLHLASTSALDFIARLKTQLGLERLLVGPDFALGRDRQGDIPRLRQFGEEFGYTLSVFKPVTLDGFIVSSSKIRSALREGDLRLANRLLGRPYRIDGSVIKGDGRGQTIGIPTANLQIWEERVIPKPGVYVCQARLEQNSEIGAVTNVGIRPTFENQPLTPIVETHLLDFSADIYGKNISLDFLLRLRDEKRFPSIQSLVEQIHHDIDKGRQALATINTPPDF